MIQALQQHNIKNRQMPVLLTIGWSTWIRTKEMPDSESGALPLGYTPIYQHV